MGLFGGKKKPHQQSATEPVERRTTRRAVVPTAKHTPPVAEDASAKSPDSARGKAVVKPGPQRGPRPGSSPQASVAGGDAPAKPVRTPADGMISAKAAPSAPLGGMISAPAAERPGRSPIQAGQSKPPEFTGALTSAKGGPCRTGDNALGEFLVNKAKLLNEAQAGAVKEKAQTENLPLDVAAVRLNYITEEQMVNALTQECWVPHLKVDKYEIRKKALDTITSDDASHYGVFPVDKLGSLLTLAMINPLDAETIRILESKTGLDIKKVVATRTEITQGIEKYYSGKVQAKDGSISFTQDIEPKSVTQMMAKVSPAGSPPPSRPMQALKSPAPTPNTDSIVPEIQDIDDLLAGDEAIAPAIIEPISIKADIAQVEVVAAPAPVRDEGIAPLMPIRPAATALPPAQPQTADFQFSDLTAQAVEPALTPKVQPPRAAPEVVAPEFIDEPAPAMISPAITAPPPMPVAPPAGLQPPASPSAPAPSSAQPVPSPTPAVGNRAHAGPAPKGATSRFSASSRIERTSGVINLIPVLEEEFQHAITHGKARVFEKWVGLQTRNRILNAVPVETELDGMLAGLYAGGKPV